MSDKCPQNFVPVVGQMSVSDKCPVSAKCSFFIKRWLRPWYNTIVNIIDSIDKLLPEMFCVPVYQFRELGTLVKKLEHFDS